MGGATRPIRTLRVTPIPMEKRRRAFLVQPFPIARISRQLAKEFKIK
jgi:hypothetical protein